MPGAQATTARPEDRQRTGRTARETRPVLQSSGERVLPVDPVRLFRRARELGRPCVYWERPEDGTVLVGVDAAYQIALDGAASSDWVFDDARREWERLVAGARLADAPAAPLLLGGFAFDPLRQSSPAWAGFPDGLLTLPQILYRQLGDEAWVTYSVVLPSGVEADRAIHALRDAWHWLAPRAETEEAAETAAPSSSGAAGASAAPLGVEAPDPAEWKRLVADASAAIRAGALEKVVLARALHLPVERVVRASVALGRLRAQVDSGCLFAFAARDQCFLGATPERLVRLVDGRVATAALAGSRSRGKTASEDEALAADLLGSAKDRREHAVVVHALVDGLRAAGVSASAAATPELLRLATVQHLHTPIVGEAEEGTTILDLLAGLHPTPAVGGAPRADALAWLREREGLARGWYAAPVGWLDCRGDGEFAVAIRSALLHRGGAALFAGCGIMGDSDPEAEYAESWLKFRPMLAALGRSGRPAH